MSSPSTETKASLSAKEQTFLDNIKARSARIQENTAPQFMYNTAFHFEVPQGFTQEEFDRVGRELTALRWQWEEIRRGQFGWSFILLPF